MEANVFRDLVGLFTSHFSQSDLLQLCQDLGVDYEDLDAEAKLGKARELILYMERRNRTVELVTLGKEMRPYLSWPSVGETLVRSETKGPPERIDQGELRLALLESFNRSELMDLAFDLNIPYDELPGETRVEKARELIGYAYRRDMLAPLIERARQLRPNVLWPESIEKSTGSQPQLIQISAEEQELLAEAKLILVGDGNVGKTSLVKRLVYGQFDPAEDTTRGVAITKWYIDLEHPDVSKARLNIWDFGGQGSMHATHPYFFSRRAVYLVVLNVREDERVSRAEYWMRLIQLYGGDSPVIVVLNKIDQYPARLDERTLKSKYPTIHEFVRTSCVTLSGIAELRATIAAAVSSFEDVGVRTAVSFINLRQALEAMTDAGGGQVRDTLDIAEYEELCRRFNVEESLWPGYLQRLNDLGVMLYFDAARLDLNVVLNPFWVTEGIYRIINHEPLAQAGGVLAIRQVHTILPRDRYPADKAMYILDMMRKFELCFPLDEEGTRFLLPDLLPPLQPELPGPFDRDSALKFQYEYPIWQGATLTRLLVRLHHYLVPGAYWRNGALLQSFDKANRALVIADEADRRLRIWVDGGPATRRSFLNRIREEMNVIHGGQRDQIKEWVITPEGGEVAYQLLASLEVVGTMTYPVMIGDRLVELDVKELLDGVRAEIIPEPYRLKELIKDHLSLDEIDDLLFKFRIGLDDLEGNNLDAKARNLVRHFERRQRMPELMAVLRELRKEATWA